MCKLIKQVNLVKLKNENVKYFLVFHKMSLRFSSAFYENELTIKNK